MIDAYPCLTNIVGGSGSDYGAIHADEIVRRYSAQIAEIKHRAVIINVNRRALETSLYDAPRYAWVILIPKAKRAEIVLADGN